MKALFAGAVAALSLLVMLGVNQASDKTKAKPKYTIKQVMEKAHDDDGLLEKILDGKGTATEKKQLVLYYVALHDNVPPRGDKAKWAVVTQTLLDSARAVEKGKDTKAVKTLGKVANCKTCHSEFKPPKK